jgi:hypothetical protein
MSGPRFLPPRPDLRHLRDEAKRRRKAGEVPSLALAQLAVAREYGFRSWPRLKFHVEAVTLGALERAAVLIASATSSDLYLCFFCRAGLIVSTRVAIVTVLPDWFIWVMSTLTGSLPKRLSSARPVLLSLSLSVSLCPPPSA